MFRTVHRHKLLPPPSPNKIWRGGFDRPQKNQKGIIWQLKVSKGPSPSKKLKVQLKNRTITQLHSLVSFKGKP